jgi:hypothetical protein
MVMPGASFESKQKLSKNARSFFVLTFSQAVPPSGSGHASHCAQRCVQARARPLKIQGGATEHAEDISGNHLIGMSYFSPL